MRRVLFNALVIAASAFDWMAEVCVHAAERVDPDRAWTLQTALQTADLAPELEDLRQVIN